MLLLLIKRPRRLRKVKSDVWRIASMTQRSQSNGSSGNQSELAWRLAYKPRKWQVAALAEWQTSQRGIVEVVTGGGKTVFAFIAMLAARRECPGLRTLIVVPSVALLDQWVIALQDELNVSAGEIAQLGGGDRPTGDPPIVVAVINSAREFSTQFAAGGPAMLIVDECHRAGSPENAKALRGDFTATLGLSATPEREYDSGFSDILEPALGPIIYRYDYVEAAADEVITNFDLINVRIPMIDSEQKNYAKLSKRIGQLVRINADEEALRRALVARAAVVNTLAYRVPAAVKLLDRHKGERAIVFHERVTAAEEIYSVLKRRGHNAILYHSAIDPSVRREHLRQFRRGVHDVLVCCRALDEGMNAPETAVAVVASSTASHRQRVQRLGRILRPAKGKEKATVYTLFATDDEQTRLLQEAGRLKNISQISWRQLSFVGNEQGTTSE
ncbi:DEAD/DEAH box helicase [Sphingopyxis sp. BE249]|nr:DEAD/DEAH box helicase [Sphingopyxis sp. BE249]MDR7061977.1 superfamily II DNA or RNA helicase [Sphingopyxis sp. BE235]MDR7182078.1 superfamily II DNA or RNA helicase [Sphingopyxis sp. BE249]